MKADLHMHTTDSDGRRSHEELFALARERGIDIVSITDHDVCTHVERSRALAEKHGITYIPGIELSTLEEGKSVHLLGYFRDEAHAAPAMRDYYTFIREGRENRARTFIKNLAKYEDIHITYEDVLEVSDGIIARPHIAKAIMKKYPEYTHNIIFDRFIGDHNPSFVPATEWSVQKGLELLRKHNVLVVLAHPGLLKKSIHDKVLNSYAFDGIEADYGMHTEAQKARYRALARERGWLITAGSDDHGIPHDKRHKSLGDATLQGEDLKRFLEALATK